MMKLKKCILTFAVLCAVCINLLSCNQNAGVNGITSLDTTEKIPENVYSSLIGLLESEIEQLRNEQSAAESKYKEKIKELESLLAQKEERNYRIYLYGVIGGSIMSFFITTTVIDIQLKNIEKMYNEHVTELQDIIDNQLEQQI